MKRVSKSLYSLKEIYKITYESFLTVRKITFARKEKLMSKLLMQRIMLAVTKVNDCPACSYSHSKISLEAGMSNDEIQNMLAGEHSDVPQDEITAIMFAQHYADTRGKPSEEAWRQVVDVYGQETAEGILGAVRMIMMGNAYGIAYGSLIKRFKGNPDKRSSLTYELAVVLASVSFIPLALAHSLLANFVNTSLISFEK